VRGLKSSVILSLLLLAGCQSYTIVQRNLFADEDGNTVTLEYGRSESDHVNTFVSPVNGEELEFRSKLVVLATLPDGDEIKAWQCMNFLRRGTMYRTDDGDWMVLANGFSCVVYRNDERNPGNYLEVYRGVLCDTSKMQNEKDERWRTLPSASRAYKKETPPVKATK